MCFEWPLYISYCRGTSDGGHVALIEVVKGLRHALSFDFHCNALSRVGPHLHGRLRDTRNRLAIAHSLCQIAAHKNFWMTLGMKVVVHDNHALLIYLNTQTFT